MLLVVFIGTVFTLRAGKVTLPLDKNQQIDKVVVIKHLRKLYLYNEGKVIKEYDISLGRVSKGHKEYEGDRKTPEGLYCLNDKNHNSGYHKNFGISYPDKKDRAHADSLGKSPGGDIKIHGLRNGFGWIGRLHLLFNWTYGCIALTNEDLDELYVTVKIGTPIEIMP
ncbi:MAG: L,D-transpeptidase family protein [Fibrobacter sp.]|nr:L,D-transpeptidase family protein [Fibrobacter sp.]